MKRNGKDLERKEQLFQGIQVWPSFSFKWQPTCGHLHELPGSTACSLPLTQLLPQAASHAALNSGL